MRRSKSNPSKYTKNYRVISQRRMIQIDDDDNDMDERKAKQLLKKQTKADMQKILNVAELTSKRIKKTKKERKNGIKDYENDDDNENKIKDEIKSKDDFDNDNKEDIFPDDTIILPPRKKKKKNSEHNIELTNEEIRLAKLQHKNLQRKLNQLSSRSTAKQRRNEAYESLEQNKSSKQLLSLLSSSSTLGKKVSKKQLIKHLFQKQKAGIALTEEEYNMLIDTTEIVEDVEQLKQIEIGRKDESNKSNKQNKKNNVTKSKSKSSFTIVTKMLDEGFHNANNANHEAKDHDNILSDDDDDYDGGDGNTNESKASSAMELDLNKNDIVEQTNNNEINKSMNKDKSQISKSNDAPSSNQTNQLSFAAQMMSGLANLKTKTQAEQKEKQKQKEEQEKQREEEQNKIKKEKTTKYTITNPIELPATLQSSLVASKSEKNVGSSIQQKALPVITRPEDVETLHKSNALPIFSMEFEIMDAIQSNLVTIVCGETGSGKSTQVPQFLYEAGYSIRCPPEFVSTEKIHNSNPPLIIGMTQPRRVAAISTAKRISYEMSCGNGATVKKNSLVSYQTRYETAGLGNRTHIKVMTDGILLQEIQSDLLLRKYSVIVLDEAHERNLNTDVLLGLLDKSLRLRRQVAQEQKAKLSHNGGKQKGINSEAILPELKLVIMSATLRIQDFTENTKLFAGDDELYKPAVVTVPGRTFPVSIHHSKITELDDYESAALKKVCKIHRKLPDGGILVFMTGKQEIERMVKRIHKCLNCETKKQITKESSTSSLNLRYDGPRDLDDDELDGDIVQGVHGNVENNYDYDAMKTDGDIRKSMLEESSNTEETLKSAIVLPLHSLLSQNDQAKVFAPVPANHRLIVVATNIAETSITIPNISYVVDTGRQKCLSQHSSTGVKSYDIMWISKASANQRAGRAGRTGPGHCYRLYSSSLYDRQMEEFAIPEVLVRPLEDIILSMKSMNIYNIIDFPFVTQPDKNQINSALELLLHIGCIEHAGSHEHMDSKITILGKAVSKLPLGVRYAKMLIIAAKCGVLDYAIGLVAVLSESCPFSSRYRNDTKDDDEKNEEDGENLDDIDINNIEEENRKKSKSKKWLHSGGDVLAAVHALGAYTYAGRGAGGMSEVLACQKFCEENGLNFVIMQRIQKLRLQLAKLLHLRMKDIVELIDISSEIQSVAMSAGGISYDMPPPNSLQELLLKQAIASGFIDNVARLTPACATSATNSTYNSRISYQSCKSMISEALFISSNSTLFSRDFRRLPEWVCYDSIVRKPTKKGGTLCTMQNVTPLDPRWLSLLLDRKSVLLSIGDTIMTVPCPFYDKKKDAIMCHVKTKFGCHSWEIPPLVVRMSDEVKKLNRSSQTLMMDESYRWFARFLLEGKIIDDFVAITPLLNDSPIIITKRKPIAKCELLVSALSSANIDTLASLQKYWAKQDQYFLFRLMKPWVKKDCINNFKKQWMTAVKAHVKNVQDQGE